MRRRDFLKAALVVPFIPKKEKLAVGKLPECKKQLTTFRSHETGYCPVVVPQGMCFRFITFGYWSGSIYLEHSQDRYNWEILRTWHGDNDLNIHYTFNTQHMPYLKMFIRVRTEFDGSHTAQWNLRVGKLNNDSGDIV